jgi:FkbM family methyltransferase
MRFDWVDIGTSDFDLGYGSVGVQANHLLVEPVKYYLDRIPAADGVVKVNAAVSDRDGGIDVYYLSEQTIAQRGLPLWVRGCNRIGTPHPTLVHLLDGQDAWSIDRVRTVTFATLVKELGIDSIGSLKIDTEGHDDVILSGVADCIDAGLSVDRVMCEWVPAFGNTERLGQLCLRLWNYFPKHELRGEDIYLTK